MSRASTWLLEHQRDVYSQAGEDGIIEKILEVIPDRDNWCVEFGAWDGLYLSNTRYLIESKGFSAVLIEGNKAKFHDLQRNYSQHDNVIALNESVGFREDDNLDQILSTTAIPYDFDFLSIDIDGNDFHAWKATSKYRPKVVAIEFNPTVPTHIRFVQPAEPSLSQGASLRSLVELGKEKGYELVSVLLVNAFFVREEYFPLFEIESNAPEVLRTRLDLVTYLFSGFDGTIFLHGNCRLPWHGIDLKESRIQHLPGVMRKFPGTYTLVDKMLFALYLLITDPSRLGRELAQYKARRQRDKNATGKGGGDTPL